MPGRPRTQLAPERRAKLIAELQVLQVAVRRAEEDLKVHVTRAYSAGMTYREIGDAINASPNTARLWKVEGEQTRDRSCDHGSDGP